ncbi:MAG: hypothetical protein J1F09_07035 [Oscillospiraceae bacterium]|nr:hypothetical protein [Oscillospiraceae bacterium]
MNKKQRQKAILKIISEHEVETQNDLQSLLEKQGITVGQATLSRDIRELQIQKIHSENETGRYNFGDPNVTVEYSSIFAQSVISMDHAQNIVVLKCHAGLANAACKVVDERGFASVVGTIAGDDTVFIVTKTENFAVQLISQLRRLTIKNQ